MEVTGIREVLIQNFLASNAIAFPVNHGSVVQTAHLTADSTQSFSVFDS
ncbi:hypothetical protein T10_405 [Trichinella papuae]|uniref:Uncharacterized protein n=1 Tax=Trichinella papuae TaxID=268474 RepID=A0A0V1N9B5_9BILA|nr:hypothetical protein T10_405 [Trichinella papuae]